MVVAGITYQGLLGKRRSFQKINELLCFLEYSKYK